MDKSIENYTYHMNRVDSTTPVEWLKKDVFHFSYLVIVLDMQILSETPSEWCPSEYALYPI